jgi:hypothetical protein
MTGYGLDGPGIENRWGARFFALVETRHGTFRTFVLWVPGLFPELKRLGRGVDFSPTSRLTMRLKKGCNYTCIHPLGLGGL